MVLVITSTSTVFGQGALKGSAPIPTACTPDALHPTAGVPYVYTLDATPGGGTWTWWATKNTTFMATKTIPADSLKQISNQLLPATSDNYGKATSSNQVTIAWSDAILGSTKYQGDGVAPNGTPTFVVAYYTASGTGTDCADNLKVYELDPTFAFTVDVLNLDPVNYLPAATTPYAYSPAQCVDDVQAASYTAAHEILYDYGTNYLYYEFVAANFTGFWIPTFAVTGLDASQTLSYDYTYSNPTTWGTTPTWTPLVSGTTPINVDPTVTSTKDGVSVYVRVTVKNNMFETLTPQTVVLTLDGQNSLTPAKWDVVNSDCALPTPNAADKNDVATQTINPRPTVVPGTTSTSAPNLTLIPKQ